MVTALISHAVCRQHDMGPHHPERPARLTAIEDRLVADRVYDLLRHYEAPEVTRQQLERVHPASYIDEVERLAPLEGTVAIDPDTVMNPYTLAAARRAAGAAVLGVDLVMRGEVANAFCNVRPPGHHAENVVAMGFCFFNNIACAAAHALAEHGLSRVAVVDFDVHHGNGTEDIFRREDRVLFCSSFQHPFYPNTPIAQSNPRVVSVPLPAGTRGMEFREVVADCWLPALNRFEPELLLVSAGFDAHQDDPMADLNLTERDYEWITYELVALAKRHAAGRIVSCLEGGYNLSALAGSASAHIKVLADLA
ncbi:MAG: histone deacetylase family protein [Pseudomonadota bacterium]|nr:histone deacetylase family protein [Pseudomonadota bacterium]